MNSFSIIGSPRSGTTLLQTLLDAHSDIAVCPESAIFSHIQRAGLKPDLYDSFGFQYVLSKAIFYLKDHNDPAERVLKEILEKQEFRGKTTSELLGLMASRYCNVKRAEIIGEKTPEHLFYLKTIHSFIPDHKFIVMQREVLDNVYSLHKSVLRLTKSEDSTYNLLFSSATFVKKARKKIESMKRTPSPNVLFISYEQLVKDTDRILQSVTDFLGVPLQLEAMIDGDREERFRKEQLYDLHENLSKPITARSIGNGVGNFTESQQVLIMAYVSPDLTNLKKALFGVKAINLRDKMVLIYCLVYQSLISGRWKERTLSLKLRLKRLFQNSRVGI